MSIASWFRRTFVPLKRIDPRFGSMTFQRMSGRHGPSYWEGSGTFADEEVEFLVDGDESGPTEEHREHVRRLELTWREIEPRLAHHLASRVPAAELGDRSRRLADWSLSSLALPSNPATSRHDRAVEIGYMECGSGELLTFEMDGFEPRAARIGN